MSHTDDDLQAALSTALHHRLHDERPDLDRLTRQAARTGTRIRRRRSAGASLAVCAGVAAVAVIGTQLAGGASPTPSPTPVASGASAPPSGSPTPTGADADGPVPPVVTPLAEGQDGGSDATPDPDPLARVEAAGWDCGPLTDQKSVCTDAAGAATVLVAVRAADQHAAYLGRGKATPGTVVGDVVSLGARGDWFATAEPGQGASPADVAAVGAGVVWLR